MVSLNRPPKRRDAKSVVKVQSRQRKIGDPFQIDDGLVTLALIWASLVLWCLFVGSMMRNQRVAQVGDMLEVDAKDVSITAPNTAIRAEILAGPWASPGRACELDVWLMEKPGGVVSVAAVRPDGVMLDWSGGATAAGQRNCSGNQPIIVANAGYRRLQMALVPKHADPR